MQQLHRRTALPLVGREDAETVNTVVFGIYGVGHQSDEIVAEVWNELAKCLVHFGEGPVTPHQLVSLARTQNVFHLRVEIAQRIKSGTLGARETGNRTQSNEHAYTVFIVILVDREVRK